MKVLFVGCRHRLKILLQDLQQDEGVMNTHCVDGMQSFTELSHKVKQYDMVILDGQKITGDSREVAHTIHAMGPVCADAATSTEVGDGLSLPPSAPASCGIEWSKHGVLLMHCQLHRTRCEKLETTTEVQALHEGTIFDYQAPCKKMKA